MGLFFIYIIKIAVCQTVFYLMYKLLLSHDTFHSFNRAVLLLVQALSLFLPSIRITSDTFSPVSHNIVLIETVMEQAAIRNIPDISLTPVQVFTVLYIAGVVLFMFMAVSAVLRLCLLIRHGRIVKSAGMRIIVLSGNIAPFSWFGNIFINEKDYLCGPREILIHEQSHVALLHSYDVVFCNIVTILCWFSPAAWLLKSELCDVHEYEADEAVLRSGVDASGYQLLLIRKAVGERLFAIANNLNHNSLKKRITMMKMKKSNPWNRMKAFFVIPLAVVTVTAFANRNVVSAMDKAGNESDAAVSAVMSEIGSLNVMSQSVVIHGQKDNGNKTFGKKTVENDSTVDNKKKYRIMVVDKNDTVMNVVGRQVEGKTSCQILK